MTTQYKATFWTDNDNKGIVQEFKKIGIELIPDKLQTIVFNDRDKKFNEMRFFGNKPSQEQSILPTPEQYWGCRGLH